MEMGGQIAQPSLRLGDYDDRLAHGFSTTNKNKQTSKQIASPAKPDREGGNPFWIANSLALVESWASTRPGRAECTRKGRPMMHASVREWTTSNDHRTISYDLANYSQAWPRTGRRA